MSDVLIHLELAVHIIFDHLRQFAASLDTAKRASLPFAARHQLEGTGGDFLAGSGDSDDGRDLWRSVRACGA